MLEGQNDDIADDDITIGNMMTGQMMTGHILIGNIMEGNTTDDTVGDDIRKKREDSNKMTIAGHVQPLENQSRLSLRLLLGRC